MRFVRALALLMVIPGAAHAASLVRLEGDAGAYLVTGGPFEYTDDGSATFGVGTNGGVSINYHTSNWSQWFYLDVIAPQDTTLAEGGYGGALRHPFNGPLAPGLALSINGRGCNKLTGWYYVHEYSLPSIAIDFEIHCDEQVAATRGAIRIESDVPVPSARAMAIAARSRFVEVEGTELILDASDSTAWGIALTEAVWTQVDGPALDIVEGPDATASVALPDDVPLGGVDLVFRATATDALGGTDHTDVSVHVESKSDRRTYLVLDSEPGDFIGNGLLRTFNVADTSFEIARPLVANGISWLSFYVDQGGTSWSLNFAAPGSSPLVPGTYLNAIRYPFNTITPGLSVYGNGSGCNTITGGFDIESFEASDTLGDSFFATFVQHCDGDEPALTGIISYDAVDPGVPAADSGEDRIAVPGEIVELDGTASNDPQSQALQYQWSVEPEGAEISGSTAAAAMLAAPQLGPGEASRQYEVTLLVRDPDGFKAQDSFTLTVMPHADLSLTVSAPTVRKDKGDKVKFTFVLRNHSSTVTAINPQVTAGFASSMARFLSGTVAGGVCASVGGTPRCTLPSIAPGAQVTGSFTVKALKKGTLTFTVTADATTEDLVPGNDSATVSKRIR